MKQILLILSIALFSNSLYAQQNTDVIRLSDPVVSTDQYEIFGTPNQNWADINTLSEIIDQSSEFTDKNVTIETEIAEVCQKKGCFFVARDGSLNARVTFKDYSFFIPTNSAGKKVKLTGIFSVKTLDEKKAKHYAEDAGNDSSNITGPVKEYTIIATSVLIPKQ